MEDMSEVDALKVLNKLQVKSDLVQWNNDTRKEYFISIQLLKKPLELL